MGHWDGGFPGYAGHPGGGRRLSDRISGYAGENSVIPAAAGLPPKPTPAALDTALVSGNASLGRRNNRNGSVQMNGPPPPPPPDAKEDPRASGGKRVSYHDMDLVAEVCYAVHFYFVHRNSLSLSMNDLGRYRADVLIWCVYGG